MKIDLGLDEGLQILFESHALEHGRPSSARAVGSLLHGDGDDALSQRCEEAVELCLATEEVNEEECAGLAVLICEGGPPPDVDEGNACSEDLCAKNQAAADECQEILDKCLAVEDFNQDECVGAAWFQCQEV